MEKLTRLEKTSIKLHLELVIEAKQRKLNDLTTGEGIALVENEIDDLLIIILKLNE